MQKPVTFLVVDDHPVFRQGLVALVRSNERYQVCAEAGTAAESLAALGRACRTSPSSTSPSWGRAASTW